MMRLACLTTLIVGALACADPYDVVISNVNVVDMVTGNVMADVAVHVRGDRIVSVGPAGSTPNVIDGDGAYLIPGLWDMHVHLQFAGRNALQLMVANGVTGVRDMGGVLDSATMYRDSVNTGAWIGPRIVRSGPWLDGPKDLDDRVFVTNETEAREAVRTHAAAGVDFIKIHNFTPREAYFPLIDEASRHGLVVAGHVPVTVTPWEAAAAGQRSVEHIATIFEGTIAGHINNLQEQLAFMQGFADSPLADSLGRTFDEHGTYFNPTLQAYQRRGQPDADEDPRLVYVDPGLRAYWDSVFPPRPIDRLSWVIEGRRQAGAAFGQSVRALHESGAVLLTGTDIGARGAIPGFSLLDEIVALVEAGVTPIEALRASTLNAARYFEAQDSLGTLEPGKVADVVLLGSNPLEDIEAIRDIRGVMARGVFLDRAAIGEMLANILAENER